MKELRKSSVPGYMIFAQSLSSIAPLSSTAALLTIVMAQSLASAPLATILGVAMYGIWVAIGYSYSKVIASYGGTYEFARRSAGEGVARAVGWTYWLSYTVYISAISSYFAGAILPMLLPASRPLTELVAVLVPLAVAGLAVAGTTAPLGVTLFTSTAEVVVIVLLGALVLMHTGLRPPSLSVAPQDLFAGSMAAAFTVAGGGASFFMGYEARRGSRDVSLSFLAAFLVGAATISFAAYYEVAAAGFTNQGVSSLLAETQYPGLWVAERFVGGWFPYLYVALTLSSLFGTLVAAFMAVQRLTYALTGVRVDRSAMLVLAVVVGVNLVGAVAGVLNVYFYSVIVSLTALFASHSAISLLYAAFSRRYLRSAARGLPLAVGGAALMMAGLYYEVISQGLRAALVGVLPTVCVAAAAGLGGAAALRALYRRSPPSQAQLSS
ncbi:amino acid permease [Acidilobus sp.]|uniref:amino acid permease n=1 Tax=Acidilobus sp. TaxID=1872109 RepID=UPI003CFF3B19